MAWERRKGRLYYYRSRWVGGRVVREYVGTGQVGALAARLDELAGAKRAEARAARDAALDEIAEMERVMQPVHDLVDLAVFAVFTLEGYHMSRKNWRKKWKNRDHTGPEPAPAVPAPIPVPIRAPDAPHPEPSAPEVPLDLINRARCGDLGMLPRLREVLLRPGAVDAFGGNVAAVALDHLLGKMVGADLVAREAMHRKLDLLRAELIRPGACVLEQLIADRVVATWLHLHRLEGEYAGVNEADPKQLTSSQSAITAAQRRYFACIDELVKVQNWWNARNEPGA